MFSELLDGQTLFALGIGLLTVTMMRMTIRRRKGLYRNVEPSISAKEVAPVQAASEPILREELLDRALVRPKSNLAVCRWLRKFQNVCTTSKSNKD